MNAVAELSALGIGKMYETCKALTLLAVIWVCGDQPMFIVPLPGPPIPVYSSQSNDELYAAAPATAEGATGARGAVGIDVELGEAAELPEIPKIGELTIEDIRRTVDIAIEVSRVVFVFILVPVSENCLFNPSDADTYVKDIT